MALGTRLSAEVSKTRARGSGKHIFYDHGLSRARTMASAPRGPWPQPREGHGLSPAGTMASAPCEVATAVWGQVVRVGRAHGVAIPDFFGIELDRMMAAADGDREVRGRWVAMA